MDIPPTSWFEASVFESPWTLVMVCAVVAAWGLFEWHRTRGRLGLIVAALGLVLALGLWTTARMVTTDREAVEQEIRELVRDTTPYDSDAVWSHMGSGLRVTDSGGKLQIPGPLVRPALSRMARMYEPTEHTITRLDIGVEGDRAIAELHLRTRSDVSGMGTPTSWNMVWERTTQGEWKMVELRWLTMANQPVGSGQFNF